MARSSRVNYRKLVPENSFLGQYMELQNASESALSFDFWGGCFALSTAVGRGVVVNRPTAPVHLNLYCIFVAESGITRKSTAIRASNRFVRPLCEGPMQLIEGKLTPEKLEDHLYTLGNKYGLAQLVISISELVTFLGREKYVEQMPTLLTDLYDCPEFRTGGGSITHGTRTLRNVFVSFLSASTPAWLVRAVNPNVIEGGFTSRVMFIVADKPKQLQAWPHATNNELAERTRTLLEAARRQSQDTPAIEISDGGLRTFTRWYRGRSISRDPFRASFQSREDDHVLRLAGLLCINDGTWVIHHQHISTAIRCIEQVREDGASIFEGTGNNSKLVLGIDKLRDKLLAAGMSGLPQKELTKAVANLMKADEMRAALDIMHDLEMVSRFDGVAIGRGRPVTIWRATIKLQQSRALEAILDMYIPEDRT